MCVNRYAGDARHNDDSYFHLHANVRTKTIIKRLQLHGPHDSESSIYGADPQRGRVSDDVITCHVHRSLTQTSVNT